MNRHPAIGAVGAVALTGAIAMLYVPLGIVLLGLTIGSLNALLAVGLILIYRTSRVINFAHGDVGGAAGVLVVLLVYRGWNFFVAAGLGLLGAALAGALVEVLVIRRFAQAPRLLVTVATIGVAQLFAFVSLILPDVFDVTVVPQDFRTPLTRFSATVEPISFNGNHLLVVAATVAAVAGLSWFFRRTAPGLAVLAAAENGDRAALCGVPIKTLTTFMWVAAAVLSGASAILQAPVTGLTIGSAVGPALLLRGLAAGVLARMTSLPVAVGAAVSLGVLEQAVFFRTNRAELVTVVLFVVVVVGLLVQRSAQGRGDGGDSSAWQAIEEVRPVPAELEALPEVRWGRRGVLVAVVAAAVVVPGFLLDVGRQSLASTMVAWAMVGVSMVVLTGWAGQVSLGQFALVGVGAVVAGSVTERAGGDFIIALAAGSAAGALAALVLGLPALRLRGFFLAVTTLAFAVAMSSYFLRQSWLAPAGVVERPVLFGAFDLEDERTFYFVSLALLAIVIVAVRQLRSSRVGRAIVAVRDNDRAAQAFGIGAMSAKLTAFAVSGAIAGLAGGMLVHQAHRLQVAQFGPTQSLQAFTMSVIGGLGSLPGVVVGAIYVRGVQDFIGGSWAVLATGVGLLVLLLVVPKGLGSLLHRLRDACLRVVAQRRGLIVPSLLADRDPGTVRAVGDDRSAEAAESRSTEVQHA